MLFCPPVSTCVFRLARLKTRLVVTELQGVFWVQMLPVSYVFCGPFVHVCCVALASLTAVCRGGWRNLWWFGCSGLHCSVCRILDILLPWSIWFEEVLGPCARGVCMCVWERGGANKNEVVENFFPRPFFCKLVRWQRPNLLVHSVFLVAFVNRAWWLRVIASWWRQE